MDWILSNTYEIISVQQSAPSFGGAFHLSSEGLTTLDSTQTIPEPPPNSPQESPHGPQAETDATFMQGVRDCLPTLLGYIGIGLAAGIVGGSAGLTPTEIGLMSALIYAGAAQFIICAMLIASSPASAIVATTFIVNLRHVLMGTALAPYFTSYSLLRNIGFGALLTDESFGVAAVRASKGLPLSGRWMDGLNLTAYITWLASTVVGGMVGGWIPDPAAFGLDYALTAMFAALLVVQLQTQPASKRRHWLMLVSLTILLTLLLSLVMTTYTAVLAATMAAAAIGAVTEK